MSIEEYRQQHAVCPKCLTKNYWKTLCGMLTHPELKDNNDAHCQCGWSGICHELVPQRIEENMNITKEQEYQIEQACRRIWDIRVKEHENELSGNKLCRSPLDFVVKEDNFEVKYLIACSELGYTDEVVVTYPKWKHRLYK